MPTWVKTECLVFFLLFFFVCVFPRLGIACSNVSPNWNSATSLCAVTLFEPSYTTKTDLMWETVFIPELWYHVQPLSYSASSVEQHSFIDITVIPLSWLFFHLERQMIRNLLPPSESDNYVLCTQPFHCQSLNPIVKRPVTELWAQCEHARLLSSWTMDVSYHRLPLSYPYPLANHP